MVFLPQIHVRAMNCVFTGAKKNDMILLSAVVATSRKLTALDHLEHVPHFYLSKSFPHARSITLFKGRRGENRNPLRRFVPCKMDRSRNERGMLHVLYCRQRFSSRAPLDACRNNNLRYESAHVYIYTVQYTIPLHTHPNLLSEGSAGYRCCNIYIYVVC